MRKQGRYITVNDGAKIYYEVHPTKNKDLGVILIHGLGGGVGSWKKEVKYLSQAGISTIVIDLRGHGKSDRSDKEEFYSLDKFVEDIVSVTGSESFKNYILCGHCLGGMISILAVAKYPKRFRSLILVDASSKPPQVLETFHKHPFFMNILQLIDRAVPVINLPGYTDYNKSNTADDFDPERALMDLLHTSLKSYLSICEEIVGYDATNLLRKIQIPTLIIAGTKDSIFPESVAITLKDRIKNSQLDLVAGVNHIIVLNHPRKLSEEIEKFLKKQKL